MDIRTVGVVGAGQMGTGIAQVALTAGFEVILSDISGEMLDRSRKSIGKGLEVLVRKERISDEERKACERRLETATDLSGFAGCDFVVEAATEREEIKYSLFRELDRQVPEGRILASNTSSISITKIASVTQRPDRVIGMHFMNPVPLMKLVEVIRGLQTSDETYRTTVDLSRRLGKEPVSAGDYPGFLANRILMPMINEAIWALMEGVGTAEEIDAILRMGANHPMGPLALADLIGLDTCFEILRVMHSGFGDPKYRPCPLLVKHVEAGWLGKKTGRGFYRYDSKK